MLSTQHKSLLFKLVSSTTMSHKVTEQECQHNRPLKWHHRESSSLLDTSSPIVGDSLKMHPIYSWRGRVPAWILPPFPKLGNTLGQAVRKCPMAPFLEVKGRSQVLPLIVRLPPAFLWLSGHRRFPSRRHPKSKGGSTCMRRRDSEWPWMLGATTQTILCGMPPNEPVSF